MIAMMVVMMGGMLLGACGRFLEGANAVATTDAEADSATHGPAFRGTLETCA